MKDCLRKSFGATCQSFCAEEPTRVYGHFIYSTRMSLLGVCFYGGQGALVLLQGRYRQKLSCCLGLTLQLQALAMLHF